MKKGPSSDFTPENPISMAEEVARVLAQAHIPQNTTVEPTNAWLARGEHVCDAYGGIERVRSMATQPLSNWVQNPNWPRRPR